MRGSNRAAGELLGPPPRLSASDPDRSHRVGEERSPRPPRPAPRQAQANPSNSLFLLAPNTSSTLLGVSLPLIQLVV